MIFITLAKSKKKPTKEMMAVTDKLQSQAEKAGVKLLGFYYTLGRYDYVMIVDAPDKIAVERAMRTAIAVSDYTATETLVALKREDALKLLD